MADGEYERPERRKAEIARLTRLLAHARDGAARETADARARVAAPAGPETPRTPVLATHGLVVGYPAASPVAIPDFAVCPGDFVCVTGANGCGKTTLIKTLAGILPPRAGTIERATGDGPDRSSGYVPQQGPTQKDFPASVREVVSSGFQASRAFRPFYSPSQRRRAARIMARLGLQALETKCYRELSGGQRQRVLLARAFVAPHRLMLLDEPTVGLDLAAIKDLQGLLKDLTAKGVAVIMVTHEEEAAASLATHVLALGEHGSFSRKGNA